MKHTLLAMVLCALLSFSCTTDPIDDDELTSTINTYVPPTKAIEIEIMELINAYRIENQLPALEGMDQIKAEAFGHTDYMIENDEVSHANFHLRRANLVNAVDAISVGENVAYAYGSAQSVVNAWLNSEGHKNVIEGDYTHFDISAEQDEDGKWYYTNIFLK